MKELIIVASSHHKDMILQCKEYLEAGWDLHGPMTVLPPDTFSNKFFQTFIRDAKPDTTNEKTITDFTYRCGVLMGMLSDENFQFTLEKSYVGFDAWRQLYIALNKIYCRSLGNK